MNPKISDKLKIAAETDDVDLLYAVIQDDPDVLENIDKQQFVDTPLHIAAYRGNLLFATEVMNLKPSFALKLNPQGFSPIHLAMKNLRRFNNEQEDIVHRFVEIHKDLVKIKGREGTLLHLAAQTGEVEFLAKFLIDCPESIEYLTARWETALHIAVKNEQYVALEVLVIWLKRNAQRGAGKVENKILNQKDKEGNTILHLAALNSKPQVIQSLVKTRIKLNEKNKEDKTALDMAVNVDIKRILLSAGAKSSQQITSAPKLARNIRSSTTILNKVLTWMVRIRRDITEEQRNTWLLIATIIATATYQSVVSPPGGVYQANASDNNSTNPGGNVGKSVLSKKDFFSFSFMNMLSFFISIITTLFLSIPNRPILGYLVVFVPVVSFTSCYLDSMKRVSPTRVNSYIVDIMGYSFLFVSLIIFVISVYSVLQFRRNLKKFSSQTTVGNNISTSICNCHCFCFYHRKL